MTSTEIRRRFLDYFVKILARENMEHIEVPSSSLIPENHPTLLFTNSGMVQFTPYFLGEKDPVSDFGSKRLCSAQKCIRTGDLDIVGTSRYHNTYFEMLGNWSIGDYGKREAVRFSFDLLTNMDYGFGLDPSRFYPTVFAGNEDAPEDLETVEAWKSVGIPEDRIPRLPASENWWSPGPVGPCGPCTEVLYDRGPDYGDPESVPGLTDNPRYLEIWNAGVFMQFNRDESGKLVPLAKMSVDTGSGLERLSVLLQGVESNYETDLFRPIIEKTASLVGPKYTQEKLSKDFNKVADHIRASTFLIAEGLFPSNKDQGYVLRRLIRRVFDDCVWKLDIDSSRIIEIIPAVIAINKERYPEIDKADFIKDVFQEEINQYKLTADRTRSYIRNLVKRGVTEIAKPFNIYQSLGASRDLIENIANEQGIDKDKVDFSNFDNDVASHQNKSRSNMSQRFKGGLGDCSDATTKLHTATHLLHQALREVLGSHVHQMGSNITSERLRFDFSHDTKMTDEQIKKVEDIVNQKIKEALPVNKTVMSKSEAEKTGALHFFGDKYGDEVSIYFIGDSIENACSKEFCGGPHVKNTSELGSFKIIKEEAVARGIRRIKALC